MIGAVLWSFHALSALVGRSLDEPDRTTPALPPSPPSPPHLSSFPSPAPISRAHMVPSVWVILSSLPAWLPLLTPPPR